MSQTAGPWVTKLTGDAGIMINLNGGCRTQDHNTAAAPKFRAVLKSRYRAHSKRNSVDDTKKLYKR